MRKSWILMRIHDFREDHGFPLKEIDERMLEYDKKQPQYDDGGIDGTPRNA